MSLNIGQAVTALKEGKRVCRAGWNGKGMFLIYVATNTEARTGQNPYYDVRSTDDAIPSSNTHRLLPWIGMKTADGCLVPWLASQTDILATDWVEC